MKLGNEGGTGCEPYLYRFPKTELGHRMATGSGKRRRKVIETSFDPHIRNDAAFVTSLATMVRLLYVLLKNVPPPCSPHQALSGSTSLLPDATKKRKAKIIAHR